MENNNKKRKLENIENINNIENNINNINNIENNINNINTNNLNNQQYNIKHKKYKKQNKNNKNNKNNQNNKNWLNPNKSRTKLKGNLPNIDLLLNSNINVNPLHNNHKESIPKRVRELVWTTHNGEVFTHKCFVSWCDNNINVFNFQVGHDIPESKGGTLDIDNLKPICGNCNLSMGNKYTITEWCKLVVIKKYIL
jgi:hypothetical protein